MSQTTGFVSASVVAELRENVFKITTGSSQFDEMLGGGVTSMSITEVFGEYRCGKTQLCHTLCVAAQLTKSLGGAEGKLHSLILRVLSVQRESRLLLRDSMLIQWFVLKIYHTPEL